MARTCANVNRHYFNSGNVSWNKQTFPYLRSSFVYSTQILVTPVPTFNINSTASTYFSHRFLQIIKSFSFKLSEFIHTCSKETYFKSKLIANCGVLFRANLSRSNNLSRSGMDNFKIRVITFVNYFFIFFYFFFK